MPSGESIDFKLNNDFRDDIIDAMRKDVADLGEEFEGGMYEALTRVAGVIKKHTGIVTEVDLSWADGEMAYVTIPSIAKNHPLLAGRGEGRDSGIKRYIKKNNQWTAHVDFKRGFIDADFKGLKTQIVVGDALVNKLTVEETCAIVLHEVGHLFAFYAFLSLAPTGNFLLDDFAKEVFEAKTEKARRAVVKETEDAAKLTIAMKEELVNAKSKEEITVIAYKAIADESRSRFGSNIYDRRSFEALADQFSVRVGFGPELSSALIKLGATGTSVAVDALIIAYLLFIPFAIPFAIFISDTFSIYDSDKRRQEVIRKEMIGRIKAGVNKKESVKLIDSLDELDERISKLNQDGVITQLAVKIRAAFTNGAGTMAIQKILEDLRNSELRISAERLRNARG